MTWTRAAEESRRRRQVRDERDAGRTAGATAGRLVRQQVALSTRVGLVNFYFASEIRASSKHRSCRPARGSVFACSLFYQCCVKGGQRRRENGSWTSLWSDQLIVGDSGTRSGFWDWFTEQLLQPHSLNLSVPRPGIRAKKCLPQEWDKERNETASRSRCDVRMQRTSCRGTEMGHWSGQRSAPCTEVPAVGW